MDNGQAPSEQQLFEALQQAPAPMAVSLGPHHRYVFANQAIEEATGHRLVGLTVREAFPELTEFHALMDQAYATGEAISASEVRAVFSRNGMDPEEHWFNFVYQPIRDPAGNIKGILTQSLNVTEQVRTRRAIELANSQLEAQAIELERSYADLQDTASELEMQTEELQATAAELEEQRNHASAAREAAEAAENHLKTLANAIPTLAWTADASGFIDWYNARWYQYTGTTSSEMEGWGWQSVHDPLALPEVLVRWTASIKSGEPFEMTFPLRGADGEFRPFLTRVVPVRDTSDRVVRWFGTNTDISAERQARAAAEAANSAKMEFLATMSHELRTPLNAISGYTELIELGIHGPVTDAQHAALSRIKQSQRHLLGMINEVLNYSRLEAGALQYALECMSIEQILAMCVPLVMPQASAKGITIAPFTTDTTLQAFADSDKVQQILLNLLGNAVKFTESGGTITIGSARQGAAILISVGDTGCGIEADNLDRIFNPFVQVDAKFTRMNHGTGLGLSISRDLARAMNGDITVESRPGTGSTFTLNLPACIDGDSPGGG